MKFHKRSAALIIAVSFIFSSLSCLYFGSNGTVSAANELPPFSDVPETSYAYKDIADLRALGITNGIGNNMFGYGKPVTRAEFVTFLYRLMKWEEVNPETGSFSDNKDKSKFYYIPVETALKNGVLTLENGLFRPNEPATREEMAIMLVRCLGYDQLAKQLDRLGKPFPDVDSNYGYIRLAKDFGIINGTGRGFEPKSPALKEQAAAMMMRMHNRLKSSVTDINGFYAISSYSQAAFIDSLTSLSCGWCSLWVDNDTGEVFLNTYRTKYGYNDYYLPGDFSLIVERARGAGIPALISIYGNQAVSVTDPKYGKAVGLLEYALTYEKNAENIINSIKALVNGADRRDSSGTILESASFDGVVIDFESMKGEVLKTAFNNFLINLRRELPADKKLYVAVHPVDGKGSSYYDAYDYKTIGEIADKVILMAHDFYPRRLTEYDMASGYSGTALASAENIYYALSAITDPASGVSDRSKIQLQISFDWVEWKTKDGRTIDNTGKNKYSLENFISLFDKYDVTVGYSQLYKSPFATFTDSDGFTHTVWYEDERSVEDKIKLARLFGVRGISIWRLGNIPNYQSPANNELYLDVWGKITHIAGR